MKRKEAKALNKFMKNYGSGSGLVKELIADEKDADDSKETVADAYKELESIGDLIERRAAGSEGDAVRTFLVKAANDVAKAVSEERGLLKKGKDVSSKERTAINRIEAAIKATSADSRRRRTASAGSGGSSRAATGAAAGAAATSAAAVARQKREVAARAAKRKAANSAESDAAQQKAEVAARAAKRRAAKVEEANSAAAADAQKAAVAKRAADRKAAADAAARKDAQEKAQKEAQRKRAAEAADRKRQQAVDKAKSESQARMAKAAAAKAAAEARTYTVKSGDTLSGISLQMYGTANKWKGIFEANTDQLKDPSLIYPGQVLKIPDQD